MIIKRFWMSSENLPTKHHHGRYLSRNLEMDSIVESYNSKWCQCYLCLQMRQCCGYNFFFLNSMNLFNRFLFCLLQAVFVGHNHGLDWCCPYKQLWLCFARHTGYGGYGAWPRGSRILEITQQPFSIRSWIRMEDGHVHSEVVLTP